MAGVRVGVVCSLILFASVAHATEQYRVDPASLAPLSAPVDAGATVKIHGVPIDGDLQTLELEAFEVFAPDAEIRVIGDNDQVLETLAAPAIRMYRGGIAGDPDSLAFVSIAASRVEGVVFKGDRRFGIGSRMRTRREALREGAGIDVFVQEADIVDDHPLPGEEFVCDIEPRTVSHRPTLSAVVHDLKPQADAALATGTARWVINIAIETDYELFVRADSSAANVNTYIANLIGAMSTIYNRELTAEVQIAYLGIHTSNADPFTIVPGTNGTWNGATTTLGTIHALLEFGDRWHNSPPSSAARSTTALISGKSQTAGVAWLDVLCQGDFYFDNSQPQPYRGHYGGRYTYNGGIDPPANLAVPNPDANAPSYTVPSSNYWPLLQLAHETGHNVFSNHTHCRALSAADQTTYGRQYVDNCYSGQGGCYSGTQSVPVEKGTIMSYCHLFGGTNSRFIFGKTGEASYVVPNDMKAAIQAVTPSLSAITAPSNLGAGASGSASVTNVAGLTYLWTVTNGTINSGQGTSSINFTASSNPTTVRVKVTNSAGCSTTDSRSVSVGAGSYNAPTNVVATATSTTSVAVSWSAPNGTTPGQYNVYRSGNGAAYALVGSATHPATTFTDTTAAPNTAYLYKVRSAANGGANESADSNRDLATTILFTDDPVTSANAIRAVHVTQLRTAVNAVRALAALAGGSYTDPALTPGVTTIKTAHIVDLRAGLNAARTALSLAAITWGETINTNVTMKASHVTELRNGVR